MTFYEEIEAFLDLTGMAITRFGKAVSNNPSFVSEIRGGRQCGKRITDKARAFMAANKHVRITPKISNEEHMRRSIKPNQHIVRKRPVVIIDRDPCGFCGTRRDLGCSHYQPSEPVEVV